MRWCGLIHPTPGLRRHQDCAVITQVLDHIGPQITAAIASALAPDPIRTTMPSISTSIPITGPGWRACRGCDAGGGGGPGEAIQTIDGGLIPRPEQVEHAPKLTAIPFCSGRLLAEDITVIHARPG